MLFSNDRNAMRQFFKDAWHKKQSSQAMSDLEKLVVEVIQMHPEYHRTINSDEDNLDADYLPEAGQTNPYLHMGMHISLQEQLQTDRPAGIRLIYQNLMSKLQNNHDVEHQMMECLAQTLWEAQSSHQMPDENKYLLCLKNLK